MQIDISFQAHKSQDYSVYIDQLDTLTCKHSVAVVTNPTVKALHLQSVLERIDAPSVHVVTVRDGEQYKNFDSLQSILEQCFEYRLDRKSTLVALGGGVIGDMTGFAASIYQRGIDFVQIPTTLLAQVDASVGGKTGINNQFGKNLVGAFWQPKAVYCETAFLKTLPKREFAAGVAEVIKMAVTFDEEFFCWLEKSDLNDTNNLQYAIAKCVQIKADVVAQDEREAGIRAALNYGHTFGHVIENETAYKTYLHGEAVAIGMNMANALAQKLNMLESSQADRIKDLLQRYQLPSSYDIQSVEKFYEAFYLDKKSMGSVIKFILPKGIGGFVILDTISKNEVLNVLESFR